MLRYGIVRHNAEPRSTITAATTMAAMTPACTLRGGRVASVEPVALVARVKRGDKVLEDTVTCMASCTCTKSSCIVAECGVRRGDDTLGRKKCYK